MASCDQPSTSSFIKPCADDKNISKIQGTPRSQLDNSNSFIRTDNLQQRLSDCCKERLDEYVGSTCLCLENPPLSYNDQNICCHEKLKVKFRTEDANGKTFEINDRDLSINFLKWKYLTALKKIDSLFQTNISCQNQFDNHLVTVTLVLNQDQDLHWLDTKIDDICSLANQVMVQSCDTVEMMSEEILQTIEETYSGRCIGSLSPDKRHIHVTCTDESVLKSVSQLFNGPSFRHECQSCKLLMDYEFECENIPLLEVMGFKEHCERLFQNAFLTLTFHSDNKRIILQSDTNVQVACVAETKHFVERLCKFKCENIFAQFVGFCPSVLDRVNTKLNGMTDPCFAQRCDNHLFIYAKTENSLQDAKDATNDLIRKKKFQINNFKENKTILDQLLKSKSEQFCYEFMKTHGSDILHVVALVDHANSVFMKIESLISDEHNLSTPKTSHNVSTLNKTTEASSKPLPSSSSSDDDDWNMVNSPEELRNENKVYARHHEKVQTTSVEIDLSANSAVVCAHTSPEAHSPSLGPLPLTPTESGSYTDTNRAGTGITTFINHQELMQTSNKTTEENQELENVTCNSKQQDESLPEQRDVHESKPVGLHSENLNISLGNEELQKLILHPLAAELLLKCEAVLQDFVQQAMLHGILINFDGLSHAEHFISFKNGSSEMVCSLIDCVLKLEIIPVDSDKSKYSNFMSLTKQYPSQLLCKYGKTNQILSVAFHKKIEPEVNAIIQKLKTLKQLTFTLPLYAVNYIRHNFHKVIQLIEENLKFPVHVEIHADHLIVLFDKVHSTEAIQRTVCILLGNLQLTEVELESTVAEYLQESGQKHVRLLNMKYSKFHISFPLPEPELLAKSPTQQQLFICKSIVAVRLCQVLVLPSYDSKWNNQPVSLLEDFLCTSIQGCLAEMKTPKPYLFSLPHSDGTQGKTVVVMPALKENNKEKKCIRTTLEEVLRSLPTDATTIALPIKMSEEVSLEKSLKIMLPVLKLHMEQKENCNTVILYLDGESDINVKNIIEQHLFNTNSPSDWIRGRDLSCKQCIQMKVVFGELHKIQADVLVNSTDTLLKHTKGQVSKRLSQEAGEQLAEQCKYLYPNGIEKNLVVVTDSFNLKNVKEIFHIVLIQEHWTAEKGKKMLDYLQMRIQACLLMASAKKYKSIAFPALGTGTLDYPADKVAKTMILTINNFIRKMPQSSLQDIFIVCFPDSKDIAKTFKAEETAHTFWHLSDDQSKKLCSEARLEVKNTLVQIIVGNARQQQGVAEVILVGDPPVEGSLEEYRNCKPPKTTFFPITRRPSKVQEEIRKAFDNAKSVQINISSFGVQYYKDIMISVTEACYELHDSLLNIIIIVPTVKDLQFLVAKCHKCAEKQRSKHSSLFSKEKAPKSFTKLIELMKDASHGKKPTVEICGFVGDIDTAVIMVKEIKAPTLHQKSKIQAIDGSSVNSLTTSKLSDERVPLTNMQASPDPNLGSCCTVSIPRELLKEGGDEACLKNPLLCSSDVHISKQSNNIVFWVKFDSLVKTVTAVHEQITNVTAVKKSENKSQNQITNLTAVKKSENESQKTHGTFNTEISSLEYEAVKLLMPQELKQDFRKVNEVGEKVTITFDSQHKMEMFKEKYNSIRKEEIALTQDEVVCLEKSTDLILEDVEAFAKLLPLESKVVIICFDYNAMTKAKHLVNVKAGRVKVTQRNKRRFEGSTKESDEMVDHQASLSATGHTDSNSVHSHVKQKDFNTKSGIRVSVYKADITQLTVDAIVNAANGDLRHGGGVAAAIALAGGPELELEGDEYVKANGPLHVTEVIPTKAGNLPCQKVLHAVGPRWVDYIDKEECQHDLEKTVFNSLEKAHILKFSSLALTSISSAIFAVPKVLCARMYLAAVQRFEQQLGTNTTIKHIHFVDISDEMVGIIQDIFTDHWNTTVLPPNILSSVTNIKRPALGTGLALSHLPFIDREQYTVNKSDIYRPEGGKEFKTDSGIEVFVYMENIIQLPVDAIVSPIDGQLLQVLGATFSDQIQKGDFRNTSETSFSVTDVIVTPARNLPCKKVLHAFGPSHYDSQTNVQFQNDLKQTVLNCLTEAHKQNVKSVALCCIGSAVLDVPKDVCAHAYLQAIQEFEKEHCGTTTLQQIHFVDTSDSMVGIIQDIFTTYWSKTYVPITVLQPQSESMTSEVRNRSLIKAPPTPGNNVTEDQHKSNISDISVPHNSKTFTTPCGICVFVYKADITKLTVNTIVSPTDDHFTLSVGVSHAIASVAGPTLSMQKKEYLKRHGSLKLTDVVMTTVGGLPCKNVLHAVGPRQYTHSAESQFKDHLVQTVFNCLQKIQNHNIQSIAFSSISSAVSGAPKYLCAQMYLAAVKKFVKEYGNRTSVQSIHFVDVDDAMVGIIQETFQRYWDTLVIQDDSQQTANDMKRNQRSSSGSQPSCTDTKLNANSFPLFLDQSTESNNKCELCFVVQFPNLNLFIKQKDVNHIQSGSVVFWQTDLKALREEPVKNYLKKIGQRYPPGVIQEIKQRWDGNLKISTAKIHKDLTLIFSFYPPDKTSVNVAERISEILNKVGIGNGSLSIPLPHFIKASREESKELESYAFGIYTAVENFSRNLNKSLTKVNIIDINGENIRMIGEIISTKIANDMSQAAVQTQKASLCAASTGSIVVANNKQCMFCNGEINDLNFFPCRHGFCTRCIGNCFQQKPVCPICDYKHPTYGTMRMRYTSLPLQGFETCGSFEVTYDIPSGTLMDKHGQHKTYIGLLQTAYLPDTESGRKVLMLLKVAWDRGLTFTLSKIETHPRVIWNGIEHKTLRQGRKEDYGYPDPEYLTRVQLVLAERGVTERSLSTCQRNFILHPEQFLNTSYATIDFSYLISGNP